MTTLSHVHLDLLDSLDVARTTSDLAEETGWRPVTVAKRLRDLLDLGHVEVLTPSVTLVKRGNCRGGRTPATWRRTAAGAAALHAAVASGRVPGVSDADLPMLLWRQEVARG